MPRITFPHYLQRRQQLVVEYNDHSGRAFAFLSPNSQWALYDYFLPHRDLTEAELREYHRSAPKRDPSLPQRAGKAFKQVESHLHYSATHQPQYVVTPPGSPNDNTLSIKVYPLVNADIDYQKLARACIAIARFKAEQAKEDAAAN